MYFEKLEEKWGNFEEKDHYKTNCSMPFVSDDAKLNVIFSPEEVSEIEKAYSSIGDFVIPDDLLDFYKKCNGCRLFFGSLSIFGIQKYSEELFEPYDILGENRRLSSQMKLDSSEYLFFGSLGGDYVFAYDIKNSRKVYGMPADKVEIVVEFENFSVFFDYYFRKLLDEYDKQGRKKHPDEMYKGIPVLEHLTSELL